MRKYLLYMMIPAMAGLSGNSMAQGEGADRIRSRFDESRTRAIQEKLFVHVDRPYYFAGEIIWCKVYCVDGQTHHPLGMSKIAYVELVNTENKPVLQAKIGMDNAEGKGSLYLPVSITPGYYKLRAYTGWMKNFGADYYYEQVVTVINTLKPASAPRGDLAPAALAIGFFPEGGNLVNGVASRVAFRMTGPDGYGRDYSGVVVDEVGDTVVGFRPLRSGIGQFLFNPVRGHHYKAVVDMAGGPAVVKELPEPLDQGYVLTVTDASDGRLKVSVHAKGVAPESVYLFGQCRQQPVVAEGSVLSGDSAVFLLDKDRLGQGINQLTLFDASLKPVCERLYFKRPSQRLVIRTTLDSTSYGTRSRVNLGLATGGEAGGFLPASLSMSVYRVDSLMSDVAGADMYQYLWLGSDLRGRIESPEYYFSAVGPEADMALDNLMLTHGWRRWKWETVMSGKPPVFAYPPELNGQLITGRLTDPRTGMAIVNRNCFLSVPGENFRWGVGRTDSIGRFFFDIKDFYGPGGILVQSGLQDDSACRVDINSPFSEQFSDWRLPVFHIPVEWQAGGLRAALKRRSIAMQVQNIYLGDSLQKFREQTGDSLPFFGRPEFSYKLDDYVRFTTMEEVLREYVREINVHVVHGKLRLVMVDLPNRQLFEDRNTLVLVDGVPVLNDRIFSYDPLKVKKLDIIPRQYYTGSAIFSGIASFITYKGNYEGLEPDPRTVFLDYEGIQWQREFFSPDYSLEETKHSRLPDFRSLLYWSGDLHTNGHSAAQLHFYTSDLPGKYLIQVQGISPDGRAGSQVMSFEVK